MTDTTKPTGDTIDDEVQTLINRIDTRLWTLMDSTYSSGKRKMLVYDPEAYALAKHLSTRLADRPNRAVARGDSVTISRADAMRVRSIVQYHALSVERLGGDKTSLNDLAGRLNDAVHLTTPTETTDPAMEGDDAD